jgi:hypothetical protein
MKKRGRVNRHNNSGQLCTQGGVIGCATAAWLTVVRAPADVP